MKNIDRECYAILILCVFGLLQSSVHGIQTRLSDSRGYGRVEILREDTNQWGTICRTHFTDSEARAVCKSQDYLDGRSVNTWQHQSNKPVHFDQVNCSVGSHDNLGTCLHQGVPIDSINSTVWEDFSATSCEDAVAFCWNISGPEYRLVPGPNYGRLEMAVDGDWGTICYHSFDQKDAKVMCRQLGFLDGVAITDSSIYGQGSGRVYFGWPSCSGSEDDILSCRYYGPDWNRCGHSNDVAIFCAESENNGMIYRHNWGRVEFWRGGSYSARRPVCDGNFTDVEATVLCREHGFSAGHAVCCGASEPWGSSDSKTDWQCIGNETRLLDCPHRDASCAAEHSASVVCYDGSEPQEVSYTLTHGSYGYARMTYKGNQGIVCDTNWTQSDALVLCRSMGYDAGMPFPAGFYGRDSSHKIYWMKEPACFGNESTLEECPSEGVGGGYYPDCHWNTGSVGAFCYVSANVGQYDVRLNDFAHSAAFGRLEIKQYGDWGAVSVLKPSPEVVQVGCKELGYDAGIGIHGNPHSASTRPVWYYNVTCTGQEPSLQNCSRLPSGRENELTNNYDIILFCWRYDSIPVPTFRFNSRKNYGRVEVKYANYDGIVCRVGWDDADADVYCRSLGYERGINDPGLAYSVNWPVYYVNVSCNGSESSLTDCEKIFGNIQPSSGYCDVTSSTPAAAVCFQTSDYDGIEFRLVDGNLYHGRLEMSVDEKWGTVCKLSLNTVYAGIICRQLGFEAGKSDTAVRGSGTVWLRMQSGSTCTETHILDCPRYGLGMTHCNNGHDVGIYCYDVTTPACESPALLSGHFGHLHSPGHPTTQYGTDVNCTWWITVPEGFTVTLTFTSFSLENTINCTSDYVDVRDIGDASFEDWDSAPSLGRYCGTTNPGSIRSTSNRIAVHFNSDEATTNSGMAAYFHSACSGATLWNKINNTAELQGTTYMIRTISTAKDCLLECEKQQFCYKVYYDTMNNTCYMAMTSFFGRNISLSHVQLDTYEKMCIYGHQWALHNDRTIQSQELLVEYTNDVESCIASCRMKPSCLAIDYRSGACTLHDVNSAETSLTLEASTVYYETTVPESCSEALGSNGTSGWYRLKLASGHYVHSYCDKLMSQGGWTLLLSKRARSCSQATSISSMSTHYAYPDTEFSILAEFQILKNKTLVDYYELFLEDRARQWNSSWIIPYELSDLGNIVVTSYGGGASWVELARDHIQSLANLSSDSNDTVLPPIGENCSSPVTDDTPSIFLWMRRATSNNGASRCRINVCSNGAACKFVGGSYICTCAKGFYGNRCQNREKSVSAQFKKIATTSVHFGDIFNRNVAPRLTDCMNSCILGDCTGFHWQRSTVVTPINCELFSGPLVRKVRYHDASKDLYIRVAVGDTDLEN